MSENPVWKAAKPFVSGSLSGSFATCCIQPMDMVKVRLQVAAAEGVSAGPISIASTMIKNEGFLSLYSGLSAGLTRQVIYTGARLGLYDIFMEKAKKSGEKATPLYVTMGCALSAGGIAAIIGNPADLSLIRMQTDSLLPKEQRAGYRHAGHAMSSILKEEGAAGLLKGAAPTSTRAMALNLGMLAGNTQAKDFLTGMGLDPKSPGCIFGASAIAGFLASAMSLPFDFVKTQMQKQKPDAKTGKLPYASSMDCVGRMLREGGPLRFYAGFPTYYFRIAPHAMLTLIAQDRVKQLWTSMGA